MTSADRSVCVQYAAFALHLPPGTCLCDPDRQPNHAAGRNMLLSSFEISFVLNDQRETNVILSAIFSFSFLELREIDDDEA